MDTPKRELIDEIIVQYMKVSALIGIGYLLWKFAIPEDEEDINPYERERD